MPTIMTLFAAAVCVCFSSVLVCVCCAREFCTNTETRYFIGSSKTSSQQPNAQDSARGCQNAHRIRERTQARRAAKTLGLPVGYVTPAKCAYGVVVIGLRFARQYRARKWVPFGVMRHIFNFRITIQHSAQILWHGRKLYSQMRRCLERMI